MVGKHGRQLSHEQKNVSNESGKKPVKHERQGSEEEQMVTEITPGKLKRPHSQENGEPQTKKLKKFDEV